MKRRSYLPLVKKFKKEVERVQLEADKGSSSMVSIHE